MNPCQRCGAIPQAVDKFCNLCGAPIASGLPGGADLGSGVPPRAAAAGGHVHSASKVGTPMTSAQQSWQASGSHEPPGALSAMSQAASSEPSRAAGGASAPVPADALRGFLVSFQSNPKGEFWPLYGGRHWIGRAHSGENVTIALADATISSRHAVIVVDAEIGSIHIEDTRSTNGTYVNDEHIGVSTMRQLRDGDGIRFGAFATVIKILSRG